MILWRRFSLKRTETGAVGVAFLMATGDNDGRNDILYVCDLVGFGGI